ncbi:MAG: phenylalanine--tRNA ligase beta subunit-related protein [Actinomycetes bacterium]
MTAPLDQSLANAMIDDAVRTAHPDYVAVLIAATGLEPGSTSAHSEELLREAEGRAGALLDGREPHELPEVMAWRQAYQSFGVKPREGRSSVEALLRRAGTGLPRIDRLTDVYNAVSVMHLIPLGGEDLVGYVGPPRLVVATGEETFDTVADGQPAVHTATPGEIIWRDDIGVTCRRWNWRQCVRTRLGDGTTTALFIIDGLGPDAGQRAQAAADDLMLRLAIDSPAVTFTSRTLAD